MVASKSVFINNILQGDVFVNKNNTCCFTGPRPHKFLFGTDEEHPDCILLKSDLRKLIIMAIESNYTHFICGGAIGFDTWAAIEIIKLKKEYKQISLELAIPCKNHDSKWTISQKILLEYTKKNADTVNYISQAYFKGCMQVRNKYMVDNSGLVIASFATNGGTGATIKYANKNNVPVWFVGEDLPIKQLDLFL